MRTLDEETAELHAALVELGNAILDELERLGRLGRMADRMLGWWLNRQCFLCRERRYNHPHGQTRSCWRRF